MKTHFTLDVAQGAACGTFRRDGLVLDGDPHQTTCLRCVQMAVWRAQRPDLPACLTTQQIVVMTRYGRVCQFRTFRDYVGLFCGRVLLKSVPRERAAGAFHAQLHALRAWATVRGFEV